MRLTVGERWRDEAGPRPHAAVRLEVDGVSLLPEAVDEPVRTHLRGWLEAVTALGRGEPATVSLEEAPLELCLWRPGEGDEVELSVVVRAPRLERRVRLRVEGEVLRAEVLRVAREVLPRLGAEALEEAVRGARGQAWEPLVPRPAPAPWRVTQGALTLGFAPSDGRLGAYRRGHGGALTALLVDGTVQGRRALPVLELLDAVRDAQRGPVRWGGAQVAPADVFEAGLAALVALQGQAPALAGNPWLEAARERCIAGLAGLRGPTPDTRPGSPPASPRENPVTPLIPFGRLKHLSFTRKWELALPTPPDARLEVGRGRVLVRATEASWLVSAKGRLVSTHSGAHGVASALSGEVVVGERQRMLGFEGRGKQAHWLKQHDGQTVGPVLVVHGRLGVTTLGGVGLSGLDLVTGHELWRVVPPRTQRAHLSVLGTRALLGTDSGTLFGVDLADGQVRFRVQAPLPCVGPPVGLGAAALTVLNRGGSTVVFSCDALAASTERAAGTIGWTRELSLSRVTPLSTSRTQIFLGGERDGRTVVVCLSTAGAPVWERSVPLEADTLSLLAHEKGVIAADARGVTVRLDAHGETLWVLGAEGDRLSRRLPLFSTRGLLVVPGPQLRVVDPTSGQPVAELRVGSRLIDLSVDRRLGLTLLREPGVLEAWAPGPTLAVV